MKALVIEEPLKMHLTEIPRPELESGEALILSLIHIFYAFAAVAWNLICGYAGTMSLGHSVYMGIGGYISTILLETKGVSPWIGMLLSLIHI